MKKRTLMMGLLLAVFLADPAHALNSRLIIKGRVVDTESRAGLGNAFLEIENASGGSGYSRAYTDESGGFEFGDLPSGVSFNLFVEKKGYTAYRRRYWHIEAGKEIESIVVPLRKEAVLRCRISASDRTTSLRRARVALKPMGRQKDPYAVYDFERESGDNG